jgi:hypothetical protein
VQLKEYKVFDWHLSKTTTGEVEKNLAMFTVHTPTHINIRSHNRTTHGGHCAGASPRPRSSAKQKLNSLSDKIFAKQGYGVWGRAPAVRYLVLCSHSHLSRQCIDTGQGSIMINLDFPNQSSILLNCYD